MNHSARGETRQDRALVSHRLIRSTTHRPLLKASQLLIGLVAILFSASVIALKADRPNFLLILADDCTYRDLPIYGGVNAKTPNLDRLADEGLVFDRAYLAEAMCQPCRAELYSGLYPLRNGCAWNHSASRHETRSLPHYLRPHGYRVGLAGKVHVKPEAAFPFTRVQGFDPNCVRNPTRLHDLDGIRKFMSVADDSPFALVVALVEPHVPWVMGDASQYPPKDLVLPPNLPDTPRTREDFSRYLAEITYMDGQVGDILQVLEECGQADDTLVLFSSEQGAQFPGCKWTIWDTGIHTALIARWPGHVPAGRRASALVQYADVVPTLLEAAGIAHDRATFDGDSFLGVLKGAKDSHREYVYSIHNNVPEGPPYPIRGISDGVYHYIRNLRPSEIYIEKHLMGIQGDGSLNNPYWGSWMGSSFDNPEAYRLVRRYMRRPAEEFYHTAEDPYEMRNRVHDTSLSTHVDRLREALKRWMVQQRDPGVAQDTVGALRAARQGKHLYGVPVQP